MTADQPLDTSTRLAVERTRLASERTLMAWIRTSTSLIAFGFTIFKFFQYLATQEHRHTVVSPWIVGMAMIVVGLTGLALASVQHRHQMKALKAEVGTMPYSIAGIMAGLIAVRWPPRRRTGSPTQLGLAWRGLGMTGWGCEPIQTGGAGRTDRRSDR
jgi:putative membrane protein